MPRGGARPNSGPKKGAKYGKQAETLSKEAGRDAVRTIVLRNMARMLRAQIANSIGIGHVYTRDKGGKFTKIENEAHADRLLVEGEEGKDYWIFMKDPSVQAFTDLMNRALDKPKEQEQEIKITGELEIVQARLMAARRRLAGRS
jgi:hypothetical protein